MLLRALGWLHEGLHALALRLIGRRALGSGTAHIDIPADLTTAQFIFVAGLPALVFLVGMAAALLVVIHAPPLAAKLGGLIAAALFAFAASGALGDVQLILVRLLRERPGE